MTEPYLTHQPGVSTEEELLTGLTSGVEGPGDERTAEGAIGERATILTGKGDTHSHTLIDNISRDLSETMDISLTRAVVTTLDGIVEEAVDRVTIVLVILRCIDTSLSGYGVSATGAIGDAEGLDMKSQLCQRRGGRGTGETGSHDDDIELTLIGGVDQLLMTLVIGPLLGKGTLRDLGVQLLLEIYILCRHSHSYLFRA